MQWQHIDDYDWCLIDTPGAGPYLSLVLGYGLVHEPIEHFGSLQLLAGMLEVELSRPVETGIGRASVPEVTVSVGSDRTSVAMRGDVATLHAAWQRLAEVFAERQPLDASAPVEVNISAAPKDLTTRFGLTSLTLAATKMLEVEAQRDPLALLRYLDPGAGRVSAVMCTNTEDLMVNVFTSLGPGTLETERSRYRSDARPGAMEFRAGYPLFSVMVPSSADGAAAVRVLAQQTAQHLGHVTRRDLGVEVSLVPVGPDMLATIMTAEAIIYGDQRSQVQAQVVSKPIPDHRIAEAVEQEVENRPLQRILTRRVHGLGDEFASLQATQQALAQARATMRFFTDPHSVSPVGYGPGEHELPSPDGPVFKKKGTRERLVVGESVIEHQHPGSKGMASAADRVDVRKLVLVIDDPQDCVVLVDADYRIVEIIFDTYRQQQQLRELIAQRTAAVPRITAHHAVHAAPARQQAKTSRMVRVGMVAIPLGIIGFALFMSWADDLREVGEPAPEHADPQSAEPEREEEKVETAVGETATLPNWSRVTVKSLSEQEPQEDNPFAESPGSHLVADVEYCAAEDADSVDPEQFQVSFGDPRQLAHAVEAIDDRLESTDLEAGQCATGQLGFFIAGDEFPDVSISYGAYPNRLTWVAEGQG